MPLLYRVIPVMDCLALSNSYHGSITLYHGPFHAQPHIVQLTNRPTFFNELTAGYLKPGDWLLAFNSMNWRIRCRQGGSSGSVVRWLSHTRPSADRRIWRNGKKKWYTYEVQSQYKQSSCLWHNFSHKLTLAQLSHGAKSSLLKSQDSLGAYEYTNYYSPPNVFHCLKDVLSGLIL